MAFACPPCASETSAQSSIVDIEAICPSAGGLRPTFYVGILPTNGLESTVFNTDGSLASFAIPTGLRKITIQDPGAQAGASYTVSNAGGEASATYTQSVTLPINILSQKINEAVFKLEQAQRLVLVLQDNNGRFLMFGRNNGISMTTDGGASETSSGANASEASRATVTLVGKEKERYMTLDAGSEEETIALLESLQVASEEITATEITVLAGFAGAITHIRNFAGVLYGWAWTATAGRVVRSTTGGLTWQAGATITIENTNQYLPIVYFLSATRIATYNETTGSWAIYDINATTLGLTLDGATATLQDIDETERWSMHGSEGVAYGILLGKKNTTLVPVGRFFDDLSMGVEFEASADTDTAVWGVVDNFNSAYILVATNTSTTADGFKVVRTTDNGATVTDLATVGVTDIIADTASLHQISATEFVVIVSNGTNTLLYYSNNECQSFTLMHGDLVFFDNAIGSVSAGVVAFGDAFFVGYYSEVNNGVYVYKFDKCFKTKVLFYDSQLAGVETKIVNLIATSEKSVYGFGESNSISPDTTITQFFFDSPVTCNC